ncbi:8-amino-7-oxononanoate synthase [Acidiferrobacter sp.]|uniref:aminotransferase class I/II-fold pyridoxal phosphate-dependent enzyme n=1 Tax=Acidiferrobacter sp. TaxID=1872107 RepID=UPI00261D23DC|nr:8-amino-7-oxononanoate synthase [Acidiferrobacter sp.]
MIDDPFASTLERMFARLRAQRLWRRREPRSSPQAPSIQIQGETLLSFASNDYLGLAADPRLVEAWCEGARRYGVGAGASHLLGGHTQAHHELEEALAVFVGTPRALIFSTGYMANLALVTVLCPRHGTVFEDRRNHASLIDAVTLAQARRRRYRDTADLRRVLAGTGPGGIVASDGVFSMDGDTADVAPLLAAAQAHGAGLLIDDAHAFGVVGPGGRGSAAAHGISHHPALVQMGTLGKAFGVFGAFVAGSADVIEALIQRARPYIYTTAMPPAMAVCAQAGLAIAAAEEYRRAALRERIREFRAGAAALGLRVLPSSTAIQPVILGDAAYALSASAALRRHGLHVPAIRPPTVASGTARLRITLTAAHTRDDVERLLGALAALPPDSA